MLQILPCGGYTDASKTCDRRSYNVRIIVYHHECILHANQCTQLDRLCQLVCLHHVDTTTVHRRSAPQGERSTIVRHNIQPRYYCLFDLARGSPRYSLTANDGARSGVSVVRRGEKTRRKQVPFDADATHTNKSKQYVLTSRDADRPIPTRDSLTIHKQAGTHVLTAVVTRTRVM